MSLTRPNSVVFLGAWFDACALWRMYIPHLSMTGSGFFIFAGQEGPNFNLIAGHDICVVQRCCTEQQFRFINIAAQLGLKIVYDLDDDVFDLPEYNPAHKVLGQHKEGFLACMRNVDVITVSTKTLAKIVRKNVKFMVNVRTGKEIPIIVAENRIDTRFFVTPVLPREKAIRRKTVRIGWAGSSSHIGDLGLVQEALMELAPHPHVQIQFRGCELPPEHSLWTLSNFQFKYWTPVCEYGARMPLWDWDIALAPVTDHPFNNSKSCIKMIEAAYCGIPCLASWIRPYEEFVQHDTELKWLLCAGAGAWALKLRALVNDIALRDHMGERMRQVALKHYSFATEHTGWQQAFEAARLYS